MERKSLILIIYLAAVLLIIFTYFIIFNRQITGGVTEGQKCTDTDGGDNFFVQGTAYGRWGGKAEWLEKTDECFKEQLLIEYSCQTKGIMRPNFITTTQKICKNGCKDGACICLRDSECPEEYICKEGKCILVLPVLPSPPEQIEPEPPAPPEPPATFLDKLKEWFKEFFSN